MHRAQASDDVFRAIADPTRRAILDRLRAGPANAGALAADFRQSRPAISKHLKVLERAGLIRRGREAQWRPCRLEAGPLQEIAGWIEHYRRFWEENFDRLDDYLQQLKKQPGGRNKETRHVRKQRRR